VEVRRGRLVGVYERIDPIDNELGALEAQHGRYGDGAAGLTGDGDCQQQYVEQRPHRFYGVDPRRGEIKL
jgi:hypothetical protein